jgi:hypothetical protein
LTRDEELRYVHPVRCRALGGSAELRSNCSGAISGIATRRRASGVPPALVAFQGGTSATCTLTAAAEALAPEVEYASPEKLSNTASPARPLGGEVASTEKRPLAG